MGFVLTTDDPYVAIDLDGCVEPSANLAPWARDIVAVLDTYTEYSPSGKGLHLWTRGQLPAGRRRSGQIEMYCQGRYMTVTLNPFGQRRVIEERTAVLAGLHQRYLQSACHPELQHSFSVPAMLGDQRSWSVF